MDTERRLAQLDALFTELWGQRWMGLEREIEGETFVDPLNIWREQVECLSDVQFAYGCRELKRTTREWPPMPGTFLEICKASPKPAEPAPQKRQAPRVEHHSDPVRDAAWRACQAQLAQELGNGSGIAHAIIRTNYEKRPCAVPEGFPVADLVNAALRASPVESERRQGEHGYEHRARLETEHRRAYEAMARIFNEEWDQWRT